MKFLVTIYLTFFSSIFLIGQSDTSSIKNIDSYVKFIDSIINSGDHVKNTGFQEFIEDGVIQKDGKVVGGYGIYTLSNSRNDTVFKIEYNGGKKININKAYYYKSNKLIFARLKVIHSKKRDSKIYYNAEYYREGETLKTVTQKGIKTNHYFTEINYFLYQDGIKLLNDFNKNHNYH